MGHNYFLGAVQFQGCLPSYWAHLPRCFSGVLILQWALQLRKRCPQLFACERIQQCRCGIQGVKPRGLSIQGGLAALLLSRRLHPPMLLSHTTQCPTVPNAVPDQCPTQCPSQCPTEKTEGFVMPRFQNKKTSVFFEFLRCAKTKPSVFSVGHCDGHCVGHWLGTVLGTVGHCGQTVRHNP